MFRIRHILTAGALLLCGSLFAQDDADLLRYSMLNPVGTARFNAMGGAFGALGANFTTLSTNPAGIGFYTRHEISLTLGTVMQNTESDYYNRLNSLDKTRIHLPQGGGIFCIKNGNREEGRLWNLHLGFGANRVKDFNNNVYTRAVNPQSSYMEDVAKRSEGYNLSDEVANAGYLAFQTGLLDQDTLRPGFMYKSILGTGGLTQKHILQEWGNITEMVFSFGGNWSDKLFFGITLGVPIVDYTQKSVIEESNTEGLALPYNFNSYEIRNRMDISGSGINLKLGLIYKPVHFFRIGLAFHTPTYYWMKETADMDMITDMYRLWDGEPLPNAIHSGYEDRYGLSTPMKGILSAAFLIKNFGAIAVEGELINYRQMRMDLDDDIEYNQYIRTIVRDNYRTSGVFRFGTEWRAGIVSFRAGYVWQSCPYKSELLKNRWSDHTATAGLGLALGRWNLDFGFMANLGKRIDDFYYLLDADGSPLVSPAKLRFSKYTCTITLGCKF
ncbi:MAG: hypothetical protein NC048_06495 [Bacteroides sp.]|nr:hypothetical protein [Ruminococcus flavefaciens]MCM1555127.1 hypothetical protein [Bacteroides sp.]